MPRRTLKFLKLGWAMLAWILLASGVIGCAGDLARQASGARDGGTISTAM